MRGILVTFEGQDGCGKSTLLPLVEQILSQGGVAVVTVPEFSDGIVGRFLQETLLHNKFLRLNAGGISAITETMYVLSDLYAQHESEILPALQRGAVVLKERHIDSVVACQVPKIFEDYPNSDVDSIFEWLIHSCGQLHEPQLTVFLRVSGLELKRRIEGRGERVTESDLHVFEQRQRLYDRMAAKNLHRWFSVANDGGVIDTAQTIAREIARKVQEFG